MMNSNERTRKKKKEKFTQTITRQQIICYKLVANAPQLIFIFVASIIYITFLCVSYYFFVFKNFFQFISIQLHQLIFKFYKITYYYLKQLTRFQDGVFQLISLYDELISEIFDVGTKKTLIVFLIFHIFGVLWLISLFLVKKTNPGMIPKNWNKKSINALTPKIKAKFCLIDLDFDYESNINPMNNVSLVSYQKDQSVCSSRVDDNIIDDLRQIYEKKDAFRYCFKCRMIKPNNCHHCSQCNQCVLKMQHHCSWMSCCIGADNYKYFCLFLLYTNILLSIIIKTMWYYCNKLYEDNGNFGILTLCFTIFAMILIIFLLLFLFFCLHVKLIFENRTGIQYLNCENIKNSPILAKNWLLIFGKNPFIWFLPFGKNEIPIEEEQITSSAQKNKELYNQPKQIKQVTCYVL